MKFVIEIETDNAAFNDPFNPDDQAANNTARALELAAILKVIVIDLETVQATRTALHDRNGNRVGTTSWTK